MTYILDEKVGRRKFIKTVSATAAGATLLGTNECATYGSKERVPEVNVEGKKLS